MQTKINIWHKLCRFVFMLSLLFKNSCCYLRLWVVTIFDEGKNERSWSNQRIPFPGKGYCFHTTSFDQAVEFFFGKNLCKILTFQTRKKITKTFKTAVISSHVFDFFIQNVWAHVSCCYYLQASRQAFTLFRKFKSYKLTFTVGRQQIVSFFFIDHFQILAISPKDYQ